MDQKSKCSRDEVFNNTIKKMCQTSITTHFDEATDWENPWVFFKLIKLTDFKFR